MLTKIIKKAFSPIYGRVKLQNIFESINMFSLIGMNIGRGANFQDSGERNALDYISEHLKPSDDLTIFDVGANTGHYSILLKEVFGEKATIHSFEPSKMTFDKLTSNISDKTKINLYNFGFGDKNARITLYSNADESGLASVYKRRLDHFNINMSKSEEIEIQTIDNFCVDKKIKHIHFLKLDIEGNELKALEGASRMLKAGAIDFIQFEFGGCNIDSRTFFQDFYYLLKDNYKIYRIVKDGLFQIKEYKETYETFTDTNYLAEKVTKS